MEAILHEEYHKRINEGLVLVDFWAPWCQPCVIMKETLGQLESSFPEYMFYELNCDENRDLIKELRILSVPTLRIYKEGNLIKEINGLQAKEALEKVLTIYGKKTTST